MEVLIWLGCVLFNIVAIILSGKLFKWKATPIAAGLVVGILFGPIGSFFILAFIVTCALLFSISRLMVKFGFED